MKYNRLEIKIKNKQIGKLNVFQLVNKKSHAFVTQCHAFAKSNPLNVKKIK